MISRVNFTSGLFDYSKLKNKIIHEFKEKVEKSFFNFFLLYLDKEKDRYHVSFVVDRFTQR